MSDRPAADEPGRLRAADGATLAWRVRRGVPGATPVLLVHGLASNASRFDEYVAHSRLAGRHALIRAELRGHGAAITRRRVDLETWCDDLAAVLQAEGGAPAVVVGHSLGAQVALHLAARRPGAVRALLLIDPVFREALHPRWARIARASPLLAAAAAAVRAVNALGLHRGALPPLDLRALDRAARVALATPATEEAFIRQYSSTRADLRHVPLSVYLQNLVEMFRPAPRPAQLGLPVRVLLSSGATFARPEAMRAALAGPRVELHTVDCHHWPLTERPDEIREAIDGWCERVAVPLSADGPGACSAPARC